MRERVVCPASAESRVRVCESVILVILCVFVDQDAVSIPIRNYSEARLGAGGLFYDFYCRDKLAD